jgi:RNA polymerase sigma-70 factor, ECF subfamily
MDDAGASRVAAWIQEFGPPLLAVARAMTRDADEAEDVLQEVWVIALRRHQVVAASGQVGGWLYRVLANVVRNLRRNRSRRRGLLRRFLPGTEVVAAPVGTLEEEQVKGALWREIMRLPDLQRQVLLLRVVEGLSTEETAEVIGRAQGTVKASLHRALQRLRSKVGDHLDLGPAKGD